MSDPRVTINIINWNGYEDTVECLESLKKIAYSNFEVFVVDNGSAGDDAKKLEERFAGFARIIRSDKNLGFAEGCNLGMKAALAENTDYIFSFQNDAIVDPAVLTELVNAGEANPVCGTLQPKIYYYDQPDVIGCAGFKIHWWLGWMEARGRMKKDKEQYDRQVEIDYASGAALLIKRSVLERIGLFDPTCFWGRDDCDFGMRARKAGFKSLYVPSSRVWHKYARSSAKLADYPETLRRIRESAGVYDVKNIAKFYRDYSTFPPYWVPTVSFFLISKPLEAFRLLFVHRQVKFLFTHVWMNIKHLLGARGRHVA